MDEEPKKYLQAINAQIENLETNLLTAVHGWAPATESKKQSPN